MNCKATLFYHLLEHRIGAAITNAVNIGATAVASTIPAIEYSATATSVHVTASSSASSTTRLVEQ